MDEQQKGAGGLEQQQQQQNEAITISGGAGEFDGVQVQVRRSPNRETYLALQPPDALPYIVTSFDAQPEEIVKFIQERIAVLGELRTEMLKHFKKTKSLKCRFRAGDVAYLMGRPFMLRVTPVSTSRPLKESARGRFNVRATLQADVSVINLSVLQVGNYDQRRLAFFSYAKPVFANNIQGLLQQAMQRVFPEAPVPQTVKSRPMRGAWVRVDEQKDVVWFSENLIPYPVHAIVYAFLAEALGRFAPNASEEEREALLLKGVENWQEMKVLLADPNNPYAL